MVKTWMADVSALLKEEPYRVYYHSVPKFRQEKADQLRFAKDKALSVGAWVLLMKMREAYGLNDEVVFNLSHSGECVLCSVEDSGDVDAKVGCDLEKVKDERMSIARRFFREAEYQYILDHPGSFFRYWVLKESFMKATRYGMRLGLDEFEIRYDTSGRPVLHDKPPHIQEEYFFQEYDVSPFPYKVAVCADRNEFAEEIHIIKL